jgi:tetratricopeptide (TPR) repeat protein
MNHLKRIAVLGLSLSLPTMTLAQALPAVALAKAGGSEKATSAAPITTTAKGPVTAAPGPLVPKDRASTERDIKLYRTSGHRSPKWDELIAPGFESFDGGNLATAFVFLQRAYDRGCRDGLVLFRLGLYQESREAYKEAAKMLDLAAEKILQRYPAHPLAKEIDAHAARALYQIDDYEGALNHIRRALVHQPQDFMLLFMGGQIQRTKKLYSQARALLERALATKIPEGMDRDQTRRTVLNELVVITYELKDYDACVSYADQVLAIAPRDPTAMSYKQKVEHERHLQKQKEIIERLVK